MMRDYCYMNEYTLEKILHFRWRRLYYCSVRRISLNTGGGLLTIIGLYSTINGYREYRSQETAVVESYF